MKRFVDSSKYLGMMNELMEAGTSVSGVIPEEHVKRYFESGEVANWMTEDENRERLESFWKSLMAGYFDRGAVSFVLIEEIQDICARLEAEYRVDEAREALAEGKKIVRGGTMTYMFNGDVEGYRNKWRLS